MMLPTYPYPVLSCPALSHSAPPTCVPPAPPRPTPPRPATQHLLDCNILKYRDDVEDLTSAAVKEEMIEVKLAQLKADWATASLVFTDYKSRGPVVLKPADTAELMEKLEESQMTLGSMSTNRCARVCAYCLLYTSRASEAVHVHGMA